MRSKMTPRCFTWTRKRGRMMLWRSQKGHRTVRLVRSMMRSFEVIMNSWFWWFRRIVRGFEWNRRVLMSCCCLLIFLVLRIKRSFSVINWRIISCDSLRTTSNSTKNDVNPNKSTTSPETCKNSKTKSTTNPASESAPGPPCKSQWPTNPRTKTSSTKT